MSAITLELPEDLAARLREHEGRLPEILELVLRELANQKVPFGNPGRFEDSAQILEFLASQPAPEEILRLRPSERLHQRVLGLIEKTKIGELSPREEEEWERYELVEHLVRIAKSKAASELALSSPTNA